MISPSWTGKLVIATAEVVEEELVVDGKARSSSVFVGFAYPRLVLIDDPLKSLCARCNPNWTLLNNSRPAPC
jgi:hypothetical protein